MSDELAWIRAAGLRGPIYPDLSSQLMQARTERDKLKHRVMILEAECTARNAANEELGRQLQYAQRELIAARVTGNE